MKLVIPAADPPRTVPINLAVMRSWLGTHEVAGAGANPTIAGTPMSWFSLIGHWEITSDEVANCATAIGASFVLGECLLVGITKEDIIAGAELKPRKGAIELLKEQGVELALPPFDDRMMARSYSSWGTDARKDPQPGDLMIIPRGQKWQGHIMVLNRPLGDGLWECIGANQSDATSYAKHHLSEAIAIRRYVSPTIKDLRAAGSTEIQAGDHLQGLGTTIAAAPTAIIAAGKVMEAATQTPAVPMPDPAAIDAMHAAGRQAVEHLQLFNAVGEAASTGGQLFVANPWIVACIAIGAVTILIGHEIKKNRVAKAKAGVPLSSQIATA